MDVTSSNSPAISSTKMVNGTKVMRATSLVMSMELKNGSIININLNSLKLFSPDKSFTASMLNTPQYWSPATVDIRQNSRQSTLKSI